MSDTTEMTAQPIEALPAQAISSAERERAEMAEWRAGVDRRIAELSAAREQRIEEETVADEEDAVEEAVETPIEPVPETAPPAPIKRPAKRHRFGRR